MSSSGAATHTTEEGDVAVRGGILFRVIAEVDQPQSPLSGSPLEVSRLISDPVVLVVNLLASLALLPFWIPGLIGAKLMTIVAVQNPPRSPRTLIFRDPHQLVLFRALAAPTDRQQPNRPRCYHT